MPAGTDPPVACAAQRCGSTRVRHFRYGSERFRLCSVYKVWDLKNYTHLYSISGACTARPPCHTLSSVDAGQIAPDIAPIPPSSLHSLRRFFVAVLNGAISQTRTSMRLRSVPASCCSSITARLRTCPSRSSPSRRGMYRPRQPCSRELCEYGVSTSSWRDVGEWHRSSRTSSTCCTGIRRSTSSSSSMRNCS